MGRTASGGPTQAAVRIIFVNDSNQTKGERLFALRGAITASQNTQEEIVGATRELVSEIIERNSLDQSQMVSFIFSCTADLDAQFPAVAARDLGLNRVPLLCTREIDVPGALERVIRVLLHYYSDASHEPQHVYLKEAQALRTDLQSAQ